MKLLIIGNTKENVNATLESILNLACVACRQGDIPNEYDMNNAQRTGRFWFRDITDENKIQLYGIANNHWAHIIEEGANWVSLDFNIRYDEQRKQETALLKLMEAFFPDTVSIIN